MECQFDNLNIIWYTVSAIWLLCNWASGHSAFAENLVPSGHLSLEINCTLLLASTTGYQIYGILFLLKNNKNKYK